MALGNYSGKLTLLRVHDVGTKFGPPADQIDADVVFKLSTHPDMAFGFTLRGDANGPAHRGMLDLLRSGFEHGWNVSSDAELATGKKNGMAIRVWLTR